MLTKEIKENALTNMFWENTVFWMDIIRNSLQDETIVLLFTYENINDWVVKNSKLYKLPS